MDWPKEFGEWEVEAVWVQSAQKAMTSMILMVRELSLIEKRGL